MTPQPTQPKDASVIPLERERRAKALAKSQMHLNNLMSLASRAGTSNPYRAYALNNLVRAQKAVVRLRERLLKEASQN